MNARRRADGPSRSSTRCERLIAPAGRRGDPAPRPAAVAAQLDLRRLHRHELACADGALLCRPPGAARRPPAIAYPVWVMNALGGIPETIDPMVVCAAKTVALSALRLLEDEAARDAAQQRIRRAHRRRHRRRSNWIAPLCDYEPPIHFRWPEYVTTPRGRDWWIPTVPNA